VKWSTVNRWRFFVVLLALAFTVLAPMIFELFTIINLTTAIGLALVALSLGLVWGYGGILCFGQTAFFGIGAYAYTLAAVNFGGATWAVLVAVMVAATFAAALGYFIFYGRVSDVYLAVITLTVTLILFNVIRRTSGPEYKIGKALLGGFNGIGSPPLNVPWDTSKLLFPEWLVQTQFGRVCISIRENELRAELIGYDVRLYKLLIFTIAAGIAGLGGVIYVNGTTRVTPEVFSLYNSALAIIWVIVGGRGTLIGPILGAFALFYLTASLGTQTMFNNNLVLGLILVIFVLFVPRGIVPSVINLLDRNRERKFDRQRELRLRHRRRRNGRETAAPVEGSHDG